LTPPTAPTTVPTTVPTEMPAPTATPIPPPTPDQPATATALARELATAVAATLTAAVTPTETPDIEATMQSRMATSVAATLTAQPTPTHMPTPTFTPSPTKTPPPTVNYQATLDARLATSVAATLVAQPPPTVPPTLPPPPPVSGAAQELQARLGGARIGSRFPNETYAFVDAIGAHINDFQLPTLGITTNSMNDALRRSGAADRANALVNQIWGDWLGDVKAKGLNANTSDPSSAGLSPFRQLVIRLIQGRQGALVDNQQHGLYNFFTRNEEDHVWYDNVNGVIGAVNRESFLWP
jgi:hypothetical protein